MARLVSYKCRDESRYSTFDGEISYTSSENLTENNRARLLPKKKPKLKTKDARTANKMPETMPTISASIEMHRNKIAQSRSANASSDGITRARRRPIDHLPATQSSTFSSRNCNWRCNQSCCSNWCAACCCWWKWCCKRKCCARICCGCIDYDDSENDDDDIDAKFERYKHEMRLNELKLEQNDSVNDAQETSLQSNSHRTETPTTSTDHKNPIINNVESAINDATNDKISKPTSIIFRYRKIWNWNDSLRSNSDKFLETLEYDLDGEQSLKRANIKHKRTDASTRTKGYTGFARRTAFCFRHHFAIKEKETCLPATTFHFILIFACSLYAILLYDCHLSISISSSNRDSFILFEQLA